MANYTILDNVIEQSLEPRIAFHAHQLSKAWRRIFPNSGDGSVIKPDFSQGWVLRRLFKTGLAGSFKFGQMSARTPYLDLTVNTTSNPNFNILGEAAADFWPNANVSATPGYFQYQTPLSKGIGNIHLDMEIVRADQMDANKSRVVADTVDGAAKKVALFMCNAFLAETSTLTTTTNSYVATFEGCVLGEFDPATCTNASGTVTNGMTFSGTANNADSVCTVTLSKGSVRRFQEGQEVDLIANSATADKFQRLNPEGSPVFVNISNGLANTITLINTTGGNITIPANTVGGLSGGANRVLIVPHQALANQTWAATTANQLISSAVASTGTTYASNLPFGLERFLKNSGGLCGTSSNWASTSTPSNSISLSRFPDYKSYVDSIGAALDERILIDRAARCEYGGLSDEDMWDEAWMTPGAFSAYSDSIDGYYQWSRNGQRLDLSKQGVGEGIGFSAFGKDFSIMTDAFIGKGKLYGLITRNKNFKMQQPPRIPGTRTGGGLPSGVEFVVPKLYPGLNDIWKGVVGSGSSSFGNVAPAGSTTTLLEAPFWYPYQIMPDNYRGMKLTDIVESYGPTS